MLKPGVRCVEGCCLWIQDLGPDHFVGGGLWRPLLDIGAQSATGSEAAGFTLLIQIEKLLSQLLLKSRQKTLGVATRLGEEEVQIRTLLLPGRRSVDTDLPPGGSQWTYHWTCHTASFGGILDARSTNLLFVALGPGPPPHVPNLYAPFTWLSPHYFPQGPYCLHSVHNSLCLSVPITSHWDSRLPTGESQPYLSF